MRHRASEEHACRDDDDRRRAGTGHRRSRSTPTLYRSDPNDLPTGPSSTTPDDRPVGSPQARRRPRRLPRSLGQADLDVYVSEYARAVTAAGGLPVHLPQHVDPAEYAGRLDGLLLSGGADVDPARYGAARRTICTRPSRPATRPNWG